MVLDPFFSNKIENDAEKLCKGIEIMSLRIEIEEEVEENCGFEKERLPELKP